MHAVLFPSVANARSGGSGKAKRVEKKGASVELGRESFRFAGGGGGDATRSALAVRVEDVRSRRSRGDALSAFQVDERPLLAVHLEQDHVPGTHLGDL
jgi:hypothetical protein